MGFKLTAVILLTTACVREESHWVRLRLPPGNAADGQEAFVTVGCAACHRVDKVSLPAPTAKPPAPPLGGTWPVPPTENAILTSIMDPSHHVSPLYASEITTAPNGGSRMPDFTRVMTVRQLVDIAAFLRLNSRPYSERDIAR
jgi:mono/diheme cytochrome c family protein